MSIAATLTDIQSWTISTAIRGDIPGTEWVFPIVETAHVIALALVFGSITLVDARLLGFAQRGTPVSKVAAELLPLTWIAWSAAAIFGTLMFMSRAVTYAGNLQFRMKFLCMALAGVNMLIFQFGVFRDVEKWDMSDSPTAAKLAGALSITFWIGVIFFGRWTGFTT
jgi:hypothetical protein